MSEGVRSFMEPPPLNTEMKKTLLLSLTESENNNDDT